MNLTHKTACLTLALIAGATVGLGGCSTAPHTEANRNALTAEAQGTLASLQATDPTLNELMAKSVGYAIFPEVGKAGFIAGGAYGRGQVYERGVLTGYADLTQGSVGLQAGAQSYDEIILFLNHDQLNKFKNNQFAFSGNVSAIALTAGAGAAADHSKGVIVFVRPRGGLMAEASIGGQQFTFVPVSEAMAGTRNANYTTRTETTYTEDPTNSSGYVYRDTESDQ